MLYTQHSYLLAKCVTQSCDSPNLYILGLRTWSCAGCFQKCFSAENITIISLNAVTPIIVMVWLSKLVALLFLSYRCKVTINVLWLFLKVLWVGLQYVIVIFPVHTHLLFGAKMDLPLATLKRIHVPWVMHTT